MAKFTNHLLTTPAFQIREFEYEGGQCWLLSCWRSEEATSENTVFSDIIDNWWQKQYEDDFEFHSESWIFSAGILSQSSITFTLHYNYHVFYDILSFFSPLKPQNLPCMVPPPTPASFRFTLLLLLIFPFISLLSAVLRADISQHDRRWSLQGGVPAASLVSKRKRGRDGGGESERAARRCNYPQCPLKESVRRIKRGRQHFVCFPGWCWFMSYCERTASCCRRFSI